MDKKVSIIMPVYNTEKYLSESIDSICQQKDIDFELIIINDGSTDNSESIIKMKQKQYNNIKYIKQENSGLSYARKIGVENATGEYIYFVDSDDYIENNSLSYMYNYAKENNLDCLMINAKFKNELYNSYGNAMENRMVVSKIQNTEVLNGEELLLRMIKNREWRYAVWLYFMKKSLLTSTDFFKHFIHEDSAFNYQLLTNSKRVQFIDKHIYNYRLRKNSLMSTKASLKNILGYINSFNIIYKENQKKDFKYENLLFEIRILDQIIEVYDKLDELSKEKAKTIFKDLIPLIESRNNYYVDRYRDFFTGNTNVGSISKEKQLDYINYLEVDIVDHCNLNCSDCSHFSPLAEKKYIDEKIYEQDLQQLSKLIDKKLRRLVLMGGEPLLHPNIKEIISISRKHFPDTQIQILTNGILLLNQDEDFFKTCRDNNIQINISTYPIGIDYYKIFDRIISEKLNMFIYDNGIVENKEFYHYEFNNTKSGDEVENFNECYMAKNCANLKNGKIFLCPIINNIDRYNKYYHTNYEVLDDDYIDIYRANDANEIYKYLSNPVQFCKYCNLKQMRKVKWSRFSNEKN